ncbi:hypothetical protein EMIHUDRAFT_198295 [Emiliania huxleyi CCMP1516]|uniref:Ankyrin repeat protein n=2 Tax=Emiliania huxleyi TaxID=2903 RepID=A0A0D3I710_EMIH1|nr:hypothetical protein EMIHUDRAFT_198295 [Emiliania huxleyi CCMP1516]EOD07045.1 hypothetical protein EMIHUDRAFT_198295 [Emiliania huxleyi CCMP1516]|eukprot:XP_005759474.1 hypothetical protein EMIHUDRAFT_198295 [Emiliania huxleyi CCMP1516]
MATFLSSLLLSSAASPASCDDGVGKTALMRAAELGDVRTTATIANAIPRSHLNIQELTHGWTAVHYAAASSNGRAVLSTLIEHGADIDVPSWTGHSPLHVAAERGHSQLVTQLLRGGANLTQRTTAGDTPLVLAARFEHKATLLALAKEYAEEGSESRRVIAEQPPLKAAAQVAGRWLHRGFLTQLPFLPKIFDSVRPILALSDSVARDLMGGGMVEPEQCAADLNSGQAVSHSRGRLVPGFERHAGVRCSLAPA